MKTIKHLSKKSLTIASVASAIALVVATGTVVAAADSSKPGDTLYGLDRGAESVQMALSFGDDAKEELLLTLAEERMTEIEALNELDNVDIVGVNEARSSIEEYRQKLYELATVDGTWDDREKELEDLLGQSKVDIDKLAEAAQQTLETEREDLKKKYEQALKDNDTSTASTLKAQIDSYEEQLKEVEIKREAEKQAAEEQREAEEQATEQESESETDEVDEQKNEDEEQREAEEQATEQESESETDEVDEQEDEDEVETH